MSRQASELHIILYDDPCHKESGREWGCWGMDGLATLGRVPMEAGANPRGKEEGNGDMQIPTTAGISWREHGWYVRDARRPCGWSTVGK